MALIQTVHEGDCPIHEDLIKENYSLVNNQDLLKEYSSVGSVKMIIFEENSLLVVEQDKRDNGMAEGTDLSVVEDLFDKK